MNATEASPNETMLPAMSIAICPRTTSRLWPKGRTVGRALESSRRMAFPTTSKVRTGGSITAAETCA